MGLGLRAQGYKYKGFHGFGFRVQGLGFRVQGFGFRAVSCWLLVVSIEGTTFLYYFEVKPVKTQILNAEEPPVSVNLEALP